MRRIEKPLKGGARLFVDLRRALAEPVDAAMDVGVLLGVVAGQAIDHGLRLLRRRGVVEVHERLAVDPLPQDREVLTDRRHIQRGCALR